MWYIISALIGANGILIILILLLRSQNKQIDFLRRELEILDQWIEKESCGEIDPTNRAERTIK